MGYLIANKVFSVICIVYLRDDLKILLKGFTPAVLFVVMNGRLGRTIKRRVDEDERWYAF